MIISKIYALLETETANITRYLADETTRNRLRVGDVIYAEWTAAAAQLQTAFAVYANPESHNSAAVAAVKQQADVVRKITRRLQQQIKHDADVELTPEDRAELLIKPPAHRRGKIPRPSDVPLLAAVGHFHLQTDITTRDSQSQSISHAGKPKDVAMIGISVAYTAADATTPPAAADFHALVPSTRARFRVHHPPQTFAMKCWIACSYLNPTGESGPQSTAISFLVN